MLLRSKKLLVLALVLSSASLFQILPPSCAELGANIGIASFDFCSVLNCQAGSFFNLCEPTVILVDCPVTAATQ